MKAGDIESVVVIGAGTMGEGIAQNFATAGLSVRLVGREKDRLSACLKQIGANLRLMSEYGLLKEETSSIQTRIDTSIMEDLDEATKGCGLIVETIPEVLQIKRELFTKLDGLPDKVILASNTGSLTITSIAAGMRTPGRIVGLHYFNPAHIVPLVEIHRGTGTTDETVEAARTIMVQVGKTPVLIRKEISGFVINRIQSAMSREANYLIDEGVITPEDLDEAAKASYGFRLACIGPMEQQDLGGIDTLSRGMQIIYKTLCNTTEPAPHILEKVRRGEVGIKSGKGWYDYQGRSRAEILEERDRKLLEQLSLFAKRKASKI
jgi:3-hydroxybutyryl-CoA dehydrogenase